MGLLGHRFGLVQDEGFSSSLEGLQRCLPSNAADLIDLQAGTVRGHRVYVGVDSLRDLDAGETLVAAIPVNSAQAIEGLGDRDGRPKLPHPFRSGKEHGVG